MVWMVIATPIAACPSRSLFGSGLCASTNAREGFFEKAEFFAVLAEVTDAGLRDFLEWAFWTGMRKGEIAKLEWSAFDRETWMLTLPGRITKNRRPRRWPSRDRCAPSWSAGSRPAGSTAG